MRQGIVGSTELEGSGSLDILALEKVLSVVELDRQHGCLDGDLVESLVCVLDILVGDSFASHCVLSDLAAAIEILLLATSSIYLKRAMRLCGELQS